MTSTATPTKLESLNPAGGQVIGTVPATPAGEVQAVVDAVAKVQPFWAQLTLHDRGRYLERAAQVLIDEADEIRDLIVTEQGKPRNEAFSMEVLPTIDALTWIAGEGQKILADEKVAMPQLFLKTKKSAFTYEPLGVIGVIAPWNYPWSIPFGEVALALMAGNGVVLKPASLTPLIGERDPPRVRARGRPRGPGSGDPRTRYRLGAGRVQRRQGLLHRLGGDRPRRRRGLRPPAQGLGARAGRQGSDDRPAPTPTSTTRSPARCGAASPTPARPARASSASYVMREIAEPLHRRRGARGPASCGSATR